MNIYILLLISIIIIIIIIIMIIIIIFLWLFIISYYHYYYYIFHYILLLLLWLYIIIIITIIIYIYTCTDGSAPIIRYFRGCTFIYHLFGSKKPRMNQRQGPLDMKEKAGEMMEIKVWSWWLSDIVRLLNTNINIIGA